MEYANLKIPKELMDHIAKYVELSDLGYRNPTEFCIEVLRGRLKAELSHTLLNKPGLAKTVKKIVDKLEDD